MTGVGDKIIYIYIYIYIYIVIRTSGMLLAQQPLILNGTVILVVSKHQILCTTYFYQMINTCQYAGENKLLKQLCAILEYHVR